jgi:hypothetical protein
MSILSAEPIFPEFFFDKIQAVRVGDHDLGSFFCCCFLHHPKQQISHDCDCVSPTSDSHEWYE